MALSTTLGISGYSTQETLRLPICSSSVSSIAMVISETANQSRAVLVSAGYRFYTQAVLFGKSLISVINGSSATLTASVMQKRNLEAVYYTGIGRTNGGDFHGFHINEGSIIY